MRPICLLLLACIVRAQDPPPPPAPPEPAPDGAYDTLPPLDPGEGTITAKEILDHLTFLASDEMKGRSTGSLEAEKAADYIVEHMQKHGLQPAGDAKSFNHKFNAIGMVNRNVCGVVPGTDGALKKEYLVFGAHYDHVGLGSFGSRKPNSSGQVHNGADDNASGTSALLELIEAFAKKPARRSVLFLAFSGEERGLLGSKAWVKTPTVPLKSVAAMLNLDMVGRSKDKYLFIGGLNTGTGFEKLVRDAAKPFGFALELHGGGHGPSDHDSFYSQKVPAMFFFTAEHEQYHTPDDDVPLINVADEALIARLAYRMGRKLADGPRPKWEKDDRQAMPRTSERGVDPARQMLGVNLAEPGQGEEGVPVIGVDKGGIAEDAGVTVEDRITTIDGEKMTTAKQVRDHLQVCRPGSQVKVQVVRGRAKKRLSFTLQFKD